MVEWSISGLREALMNKPGSQTITEDELPNSEALRDTDISHLSDVRHALHSNDPAHPAKPKKQGGRHGSHTEKSRGS